MTIFGFVCILLTHTHTRARAYIGLEQKFVAFFSPKISIFYKISMTSFDKAKFQLSESVLQITIFNGVTSNQSQNFCLT